MSNPFNQEVPYGTRKILAGLECVYMPDPYTFPVGYGNAWCAIRELETDGIEYPGKETTLDAEIRLKALEYACKMDNIYTVQDLITTAKIIEDYLNFKEESKCA